MILLKGTHGTSVSNSMSIRKDGFKPSGGRRGDGVYFWKEGPYALLLARESYEHRRVAGGFTGQKIQNRAVIKVVIELEEESYVDLTSGDNYDELEVYMAKIRGSFPPGGRARHEFIERVFNFFFVLLRRECEHTLKVVYVCVPSPVKKGSFDVDVLGHPRCYVVWDSSIIEISEVTS